MEKSAEAAVVSASIDAGEVIESVACEACPSCAELDGDGYVFVVLTEE